MNRGILAVVHDWLHALKDQSALRGLTKTSVSAEDERRLPSDYVAFLREVGSGDIGPGWIMLYGGPVEPDSIYGARVPTAQQLEPVTTNDAHDPT